MRLACLVLGITLVAAALFLTESPGAMVTCRLELMGLPDAAAYQRMCRGLLPELISPGLLSGLNVPNKKPGEPLIDWISTLRNSMPMTPKAFDLCVHYSLKHQRQGRSEPSELFAKFCRDAAAAGASRVLLVTGPRGPAVDAVAVLERLQKAGGRECLPDLRLGVAFNACLPEESDRALERARLVRKLQTGLVDEVWLNTGSDVSLLNSGISFVRQAVADTRLRYELPIFGSILLPNEAQLNQMRERPWNGVHFSDEYLSCLAGMEQCTREVLAAFHASGVEPIVESKVRNFDDVGKLQNLLRRLQKPSMSPEPMVNPGDDVDTTEVDTAIADSRKASRHKLSRRGHGSTGSTDSLGGKERKWNTATSNTLQPSPGLAPHSEMDGSFQPPRRRWGRH